MIEGKKSAYFLSTFIMIILTLALVIILVTNYNTKPDLQPYISTPNLSGIKIEDKEITFNFERSPSFDQDIYALIEKIQETDNLNGYTIKLRADSSVITNTTFSKIKSLDLQEYNPNELLAKIRGF